MNSPVLHEYLTWGSTRQTRIQRSKQSWTAERCHGMWTEGPKLQTQTAALRRDTFSLLWRWKGKKGPAAVGTLQERAYDWVISTWQLLPMPHRPTPFPKCEETTNWKLSIPLPHSASPSWFSLGVTSCLHLTDDRHPQEAKISIYSNFASNVQFSLYFEKLSFVSLMAEEHDRSTCSHV